jgi:hypothetical protein
MPTKRKLSDTQIAEIKRRLLARSVFWQSQRSIAKEFFVAGFVVRGTAIERLYPHPLQKICFVPNMYTDLGQVPS